MSRFIDNRLSPLSNKYNNNNNSNSNKIYKAGSTIGLNIVEVFTFPTGSLAFLAHTDDSNDDKC